MPSDLTRYQKIQKMNYQTAFLNSILLGRYDIFKDILTNHSNEINLNGPDYYGSYPLSEAIVIEQWQMAIDLLNAGANFPLGYHYNTDGTERESLFSIMNDPKWVPYERRTKEWQDLHDLLIKKEMAINDKNKIINNTVYYNESRPLKKDYFNNPFWRKKGFNNFGNRKKRIFINNVNMNFVNNSIKYLNKMN